jgi:transcriptional regulator with XRE-family HTH domain
LVYTLEIEVNMLDFNPKYPENLGEKIRKVRMDKGLMIKELASQLGVTEDTVINWEIRGIKPVGRNIDKLQEFLKNSPLDFATSCIYCNRRWKDEAIQETKALIRLALFLRHQVGLSVDLPLAALKTLLYALKQPKKG